MASTKLPSLEQLKRSLSACQGKIAEVLSAVSDALSEMDEKTASKEDLDTLTQRLMTGELLVVLTASDGSVLVTADSKALTANRKIGG